MTDQKKIPALAPVKSSNIMSIGYDDNALFVKFHSGDIWKYLDVTAQLHENLMNAESVGKFFGAYIKGKYASVKV